MDKALAPVYPEIGAGGFTRIDGTIEFYQRINALLKPDMVVLDLGAGRGCQFEDGNDYRRSLVTIQGKVAKVIGIDVDPAVLTNDFVDEKHVYDGRSIPLEDGSVDLIFSDWVLEHIDDPAQFAAEVNRVLKGDGWFCARTITSHSYIALASRMVPNRLHARVLKRVQAGTRKGEDVFPALYRLNSSSAIRKHFPKPEWRNYSYSYSPAPSYHFGRRGMVRALSALQYLKAPFGGENLFVFVQKRGTASSDEC